MGVTTDILVADRNSVRNLSNDDYPPDLFPSGECFKGIRSVELSALEFILDNGHSNGCPKSAESADEVYEKCLEQSDDGPWVFAIPKSLSDKTARLEDEELPGIATAWTETSGLRSYGYKPAHALESLRELRRLARIAIIEKKELFMYVSL